MGSISASQASSPPNNAEGSSCTGCPDAHQCRSAWSAERRGPFSPAGLSISSAIAFLLPVITAIIGCALAGKFKGDAASVGWDIIGAGVGLGVGTAIALAAMPAIKKHFGSDHPENNS